MSGRQARLPHAGHHVFEGGEAALEEDGGDQGVEAERGAVLHSGDSE